MCFPQDVTASSLVSCSQEKKDCPETTPPSPVQSERDALLVGKLDSIPAFTAEHAVFCAGRCFIFDHTPH